MRAYEGDEIFYCCHIRGYWDIGIFPGEHHAELFKALDGRIKFILIERYAGEFLEILPAHEVDLPGYFRLGTGVHAVRRISNYDRSKAKPFAFFHYAL